MSNPKDLKPYKLSTKDVSELQTTVDDLQKELSTLRVNKVSSGVASKLAKIRVVRKAIARSLTYINFKRRDEVKDAFKKKSALRTYNEEHKTNWRFSDKPFACRERRTRAQRRALTQWKRLTRPSNSLMMTRLDGSVSRTSRGWPKNRVSDSLMKSFKK